MREIPKTHFMDFGLLYENDKGEYVVLNDVRIADIRLASLVYLLVYVSTYCTPIELLHQNEPFRLPYWARPNNNKSNCIRHKKRRKPERAPMKNNTTIIPFVSAHFLH